MSQVRENPLPIGRYWVNVPANKLDSFKDWLKRNKDFVYVVTTETTHDDNWGDTAWYLFETLTPYVEWEGPGFPSIAGDGIHSQSDTTERPDPEPDLIDTLKTVNPTSGLIWIGGGLIALALARLLKK